MELFDNKQNKRWNHLVLKNNLQKKTTNNQKSFHLTRVRTLDEYHQLDLSALHTQ